MSDAERERISRERWERYCTIAEGELVIDAAYFQNQGSSSFETAVESLLLKFCAKHKEEKVWAGIKTRRRICRSCTRDSVAKNRTQKC